MNEINMTKFAFIPMNKDCPQIKTKLLIVNKKLIRLFDQLKVKINWKIV